MEKWLHFPARDREPVWQVYCQTNSHKTSQKKKGPPSQRKRNKRREFERIPDRVSSAKLVLSPAHQSRRRVHLLRAQRAVSLTVPLSNHISIIYSALPSYQPRSALKCQKRPHISPSTQTAPGERKKSSLLLNIHHVIHLQRRTRHVQHLSEFCCEGGWLIL